MKWRSLILLTIAIFSLATTAIAEEINIETTLSLISPYDKLTTGLGGTWRPEFLEWKRFSLGLGAIANLSTRFYYETTPISPIPDSAGTGWMYTNDNHMETGNFDFNLESRWRVCGDCDYTKWKAWLTLNAGEVISTGGVTRFQTIFRDSANYVVNGPVTYMSSFDAPTRFDPYLSPGFLIGIGNFTVGYRQWFYLKNLSLKLGEAGRLWGTLRVGYRFQW